MSGGGVLVLAELTPDGGPRSSTRELIGAALALAAEGAGPVTVALLTHDPEGQLEGVRASGVAEVLLLRSPLEHFEAHVAEAALEALIEVRRPAIVLAGHTVDSIGFAPAVAARRGLGFAGDVTAVSWEGGRPLARRGAYGEKLIAELDFPGKESVLLLLRPGAFPAAADQTGVGTPESSWLEVNLEQSPRTRRTELREAPTSDVDIAEAEMLLSIGRGIGAAERVADFERLARLLGATLACSGPLVEAGWVSRVRKVGQSGKTVAPKVYLALGISGAPQHLAGMSRSRMIIAVNSDPQARIFDVADYGAVADLHEVAAELERRLEH
jgi:electron transfer flavoprotein alpha subunit